MIDGILVINWKKDKKHCFPKFRYIVVRKIFPTRIQNSKNKMYLNYVLNNIK